MPSATSTAPPAASGKARLLSGVGGQATQPSGRTRTATASTTFAKTVPLARAAPTAAARPHTRPAPAQPAPALPRWAKGFVIGGVLLALAMPATVLMSRSMLVQEALAAESTSKAALVCTAGEARAVDGSSLMGWLFGGSFFSCGDWETRETRVQRERDQAQANYMARERARQGLQ